MGKLLNEQETYTRNVGYDLYIIYNASGRQEYVMMAYPFAATSAAKWQIYKLKYSAAGRLEKRRYAGGSDAFDKIADNYSSYNYLDI